MWVEQTKDGRFKFIERYVDPYTQKNTEKNLQHLQVIHHKRGKSSENSR